MAPRCLSALLLLLGAAGCGSSAHKPKDQTSTDPVSSDAAMPGNVVPTDAGRVEDADGTVEAPDAATCTSNAQCDDGLFCTGLERCSAGTCTQGSPPCEASLCNEGQASCPFPTVDLDRDGDPMTTDCDDKDPARYHGAMEDCDTNDEDCDPQTLGPDRDRDGVVASECCNPQASGAPRCGSDCDDDDPKVFPSAKETCNGVDDDCNSQVDEGSPTSDALCSVSGQTCKKDKCECPSAQEVCGDRCLTLGGTCTQGIGACARSGVVACTNGTSACNAIAGNPTAEVCDGVDNDCNGAVDEGVKISCYPDSDNDGYASNSATSQQCPDSGRGAFGRCPFGYVAPAASLGMDCNAGDGTQYRLESTSADADNDGRCAGGAIASCVGTTPPLGRRFTSSCSGGSDCNDSNGAVYQTVSVRTDSDGDGFCIGNPFDQCTAGSASGATRLSATCSGTDCRDSNPNATNTCSIGDGFLSTGVRKSCTIGPPPEQTFGVSTATACPPGFSPTNIRTQVASSSQPGGNCSASGTSAITVRCGGVVLGWVDCRIVADCSAN